MNPILSNIDMKKFCLHSLTACVRTFELALISDFDLHIFVVSVLLIKRYISINNMKTS